MTVKSKSRRGIGLVSIAPYGSQKAGARAPSQYIRYFFKSRVKAFFDDPANAARFEAWKAERGSL